MVAIMVPAIAPASIVLVGSGLDGEGLVVWIIEPVMTPIIAPTPPAAAAVGTATLALAFCVLFSEIMSWFCQQTFKV